MSRIQATFTRLKNQGDCAIMPYIPVGYPTMESSEGLIRAMCESGADLIELGVPCSDPLADGPTIQEAGATALANGADLHTCMETVASLRSSGLETPIVLMGYCNSFLAYGIERLAIDAAQAGVDGFIIPDLPSTMADPWVDVLSSNGLDLIFFLAPTTSEQRAASIVQKATGFLYCISVTGVTGARENLTEELPVFLKYARSLTDLPLCVGFGITNATHVNQVSQYADGAIVGSALINLIKRSEPAQVEMKVREFIETLKRATRTVVKR